MDWNTKPEDNAALSSYLESQSHFLRKALSPHTLTPQSSCNYSRNNQEVFVCPNNKNATLQSLQYQNIESPQNPQQASHPDMSSRVVVIPETSTERIPFSQLKVVPNQPDQSSHRSLEAPRNSWLSSSVSDSVFFNRGLSGMTSQTSVGGSVHNALKSQDQYISSNTCTMQLQMLSNNPSKVPSLYPGNQASNLYSAEQQVGWVPPCTSSGLTLPFHEPSQYLESQRGIVTNLSNTNIQKQPAISATPLQVRNNQLLNPNVVVGAPPPPYPTVQSRQYAAISMVTETGNRNLPNYYCRLIPPFQKNSQYLAQNPCNEVLHTQQVHLSETKRVFGRDCQQQWQNTNENGHQKLNVETNYSFNEAGNSFAVGGIPQYKNKQMRTNLYHAPSESLSKIPGPSNQINSHSLGEGSGFLGKSSSSLREGSNNFVKGSGCHREGGHSASSEIDISREGDSKITKEGLFKDIRKLLAMKNEFLKLAKEIKIKKSFLSESQDKTPNSSLPQNPAMSLQPASKDQSFPLLMSINSEHQPLTVMQSTEDTNKTNNTLNSSIKEVDCSRQINQGNLVLPNSIYSGKLQSEQVNVLLQEPSPVCQKILSAINPAPTVSNQTPLDFNKGDRLDRPQQSGDTIKTVAQQRQKVLKNKEDHYKLLSHLLKSNNTTLDFTPKIMNQETVAKGVSENMQDCNKSIHSVVKQNTEVISAQSRFKNTGIPMTTVVNAESVDASIKLKDRTSILLSGKCTKDNNYSMEELTACLALWKKPPSESTNVKSCDTLGKSKVSDGMSSPTAVRNVNETVLPTVNVPIGHKHESGNLNLTKGIELQVAVVSPLILSEVKPLSDQPLKPTSLESVFPVIQEGSVCSLQDQVKEKAVASSNVTIKRTEISVATDNLALTNKFDSKLQDIKSANGIVHLNINSFSSEKMKEKPDKPEPHLSHLEKDICSPNNANNSGQGIEQKKEEQISKQLVDDTPMNDDLLQIASVCSLVEGDMFYNSQIANMFNVPSTEVDKKEVSLPDNTAIDNEQLKEKLNQTKFESVSKGPVFLKISDVLPKISYGTKPLETSKSFKIKHCETNDRIEKQKNVEQNIEKTEVVSNKCCSSTDNQPDLDSKEIANVSSKHFIKEPLSCVVQNIEQANSEIIFDKAASVKYLDDQLSELVEEFPYGIESGDTHSIPAENKNSSLQLTMNPVTKDKEIGIKSNCNSDDAVNQIKITILSSERMKELFPKEDKEICKGDDNLDKLEDSQIKESTTEVQNHCNSSVKTTKDNVNSAVPSTGKDDVHCCALGWLSTVYDGVPQCLCDSRKKVTTEEKLDDQSSVSESLNYKEDPATDGNILVTKVNSLLKNNLQNSPAYPERKRSLFEMEQDEIKCSPKDMEKEKPSFSSKVKIVKYNERDSQENPQKKLKARNLMPLNGEKRKPHFWSIKNKEFLKKECSSRDVLSREKLKRKFKSGCSKFKNPKWKLEQPTVSNMEHKKKKYELEQKTCIVNGSKLCESLSSTNEENCCEEKTSTDAKSTNLERNVPQNIMNTSDVNLNSTKSDGSPCKINKVLSSQDYFQRQKKKEKIGKGDLKHRHESEKLKKNRPHVSEYAQRNKLTIKLVNHATSNDGHSVRKYKRPLDYLTHHNKAMKSYRSIIHHSKDSRICGISRNVQEKIGEKQLDNVVIRKANKYNQTPLQGKDQKEQKKLYLNRVAFKRTAQESICLTKLDCSPRRSLNQVNDGNESNQDSLSLEKDKFEKPRMLEFKLCPEELFKNGNSEEHTDFKTFPRKEQVPVQGIKSTKEDWLKCIPQKKRTLEAIKDKGTQTEDYQEYKEAKLNKKESKTRDMKDDSALSDSRVYKRTLSEDGCKAVQNLPKDSKTMFQTYKKLYLEKRSRSLDDSPTK